MPACPDSSLRLLATTISPFSRSCRDPTGYSRRCFSGLSPPAVPSSYGANGGPGPPIGSGFPAPQSGEFHIVISFIELRESLWWHGVCRTSHMRGWPAPLLGRLLMPARRLLLQFIVALAVAFVPAIGGAQAPERVIKIGTLKLIHAITPYFYEKFAPAGYKIEVIPFESPTDGKNAVMTGTVDFGTFGIAAATLGAAAGEPLVIFAAQCNRGMAVVAGANSDIKSIKDLRGRKVAIWPGSTQEVVILERLKAEGMTIKDIQHGRLPFSDMEPALARGDG